MASAKGWLRGRTKRGTDSAQAILTELTFFAATTTMIQVAGEVDTEVVAAFGVDGATFSRAYAIEANCALDTRGFAGTAVPRISLKVVAAPGADGFLVVFTAWDTKS